MKKAIMQLILLVIIGAAVICGILFVEKKKSCSKDTPKQTEPAKTEPTKTEPATKVEEESEMKVENDDGSSGSIRVTARRDGLIIAIYSYDTDIDAQFYLDYLRYENSRGSEVFIELDRDDNVPRVSVLGKHYYCSEPENADLCKKATEKVAYWKSIMKWDERVKRILEELKNRKPEEELD